MADAILTLNAGSSSIKFALFALGSSLSEQAEIVGQIDGIGARPHLKAKGRDGSKLDDADIPLTGSTESQHHAALGFLVDWLRSHGTGWNVVAVGHRVVHGGQRYSAPMLLDDATIDFLTSLVPLAPLHQPHNLDGIAALREHLPHVPQVGCFDTAFHRSQPEVAQRFGLPRKYHDEGVRRYGFHGLSYEYIADTLPRHLGDKADGKVIVAHLGNGASMSAMENRRGVASTMGLTAVDGLMMGTRTGNIDPGVLLYLMDNHGMDAKALTRLLYKESGLLGVSGLSQDMRTLLASDTAAAKEAVELFCYRIVRETGSLAAALGGLDALVFTGGIGEHAVEVRARVAAGLGWLGIKLDDDANGKNAILLSRPDESIPVLCLPTNEEWMIARHTEQFLTR